jgi:signal transduction histidine kinase
MIERCAHCGSTDPAFEVLSDAVLTVASEVSVSPMLTRLADAARKLTGARYAAIGVPDGEGGFAQFVTSGLTDKQWDAIGELPRQHGLLGAMLQTTDSFRTQDIQRDPRFEGWPAAHPSMRSFLGVPIVSGGSVIGAVYVTDKKGGRGAQFDDEDQRLTEMLAAHAAIAIEKATLYERSRELSIVEERKRLARELHDSVTQSLFAVSLAAEATATLVDVDPPRAKRELEHLHELARSAMDEMRSLIFELRPAELETDGLAPTLRKHADVLRRVYGREIEVTVEVERPLPPELERGLLRIAQEALANALKHSGAEHVGVELRTWDSRLRLTVADDGAGFEPEEARAKSRRLGLVSMRERAEALGGELAIESKRGEGTRVSVEVSVGRDPRPPR